MPEASGEPKKVPKRVEVEQSGLIRNTGQVDLYDRDPDYAYQAFSRDPKSPAHIDRFTRRHLYGEGRPWCQWINGWEPVNASTDRSQAPLTSTAQGHAIDTLQRGPGDQIICRMHKKEHAKYMETDRKNAEEDSTQLGRPDRQQSDQHSLTTVLRDGTVHPAQALTEAGHAMPSGMTIRQ